MPRSGAASTARRTAAAPSRWPATRGRPRRVAQRPLPSMMIATCSGRGWPRTTASSSASPSPASSTCARRPRVLTPCDGHLTHGLEGQNFLLLLLQELVHLRDVFVGGLLDLVVTTALLVLGDLLVARHRLELVVRLAPNVPDRDTGFLGVLGDRFRELLPALLGRGWDREPDHLSVVDRREPEVRRHDGLLDRLELARFPRLDRERAGV